jgi:hypothetical protein
LRFLDTKGVLLTPDEVRSVGSLADRMADVAYQHSEGATDVDLPHPMEVMKECRERCQLDEYEQRKRDADEAAKRRAEHVPAPTIESNVLVDRALRSHGLAPGQEREMLIALAARLGERIFPPKRRGPKARTDLRAQLDEMVFEADIREVAHELRTKGSRFTGAGAIATVLLKREPYASEFGGKEGGHARLQKRIEPKLKTAAVRMYQGWSVPSVLE